MAPMGGGFGSAAPQGHGQMPVIGQMPSGPGQGQRPGHMPGQAAYNPVSSSGFSPATPISPAAVAAPVAEPQVVLELPECAGVLGEIIAQLTGKRCAPSVAVCSWTLNMLIRGQED